MDPPQDDFSTGLNMGSDIDADGIWTIDIVLPAGVYQVQGVDEATLVGYGLYGTSGEVGASTIINRDFTVEIDATSVAFYFDIRDKAIASSMEDIPVVCGDFMSAAGYYSETVGVGNANWNPDNLLGWMKNTLPGAPKVYQMYLHVPFGQWNYKVGFHGADLAARSVGFGGTQFPFSLNVKEAEGRDVVFIFDAETNAVSDNIGLNIPNLFGLSPITATTLGDHALTPYVPDDMTSWVERQFSFVGDFGPALATPQIAYDVLSGAGADDDADAVWALQLTGLAIGSYQFVVTDVASGEAYDTFGQLVSGSIGVTTTNQRSFEVTGEEEQQVVLYFDPRDLMFESTANEVPVLCGDFMSAAGYYGAGLGASAADWNPDNMLGWMKSYEGKGVHRTFLHVPQGTWKYKICFAGRSREQRSIGLGGSQFPMSLVVTAAAGAKVVFVYDSISGGITDSVNGDLPTVLVAPMGMETLGDNALAPFLSSEIVSWASGQTISLPGTYGSALTPPLPVDDVASAVTVDSNGDGIWERTVVLKEGTYQFHATDTSSGESYNSVGELRGSGEAVVSRRWFSVPSGGATVTLFFDPRDGMFEASNNFVPVLCGDFMATAGYFAQSLAATPAAANWNPTNMLGWMKDYDGTGVYRLFLHVPQGNWHYKIGFSAQELATNSVGFGGSVFPFTLEVSDPSGLDVAFIYNSETGFVYDSVNGASQSLKSKPVPKSNHKLNSLMAFRPAQMGLWKPLPIAFPGLFSVARTPPFPPYDVFSALGADPEGDGIVTLNLVLRAGNWNTIALNAYTFALYDAFGNLTPFDPAILKFLQFSVAEDNTPVVLYFDHRDTMFDSSTNNIPVVVGDFMVAAGYYGPGHNLTANWNPDNMLGWMKDYDRTGFYQAILYLPAGQWSYKVGFATKPLNQASVGFGGPLADSKLPVHLTIPEGGRDVVFVYDPLSQTVTDSINGLPPPCSTDCGVHGECKSNQCFCEPGYHGEVCEIETHFSYTFMKAATTTVNGTVVYSDGPPRVVPTSGPVVCAGIITLASDGSSPTCSVKWELYPETATTIVDGTVLTEVGSDGVERPVYSDGPPVQVPIMVPDDSKSCDDRDPDVVAECADNCEPGWIGTMCSLEDHCKEYAADGSCVACDHGWSGDRCTQLVPVAGGGGYGLDIGRRYQPWFTPPIGARGKPSFRGNVKAVLETYELEWICKQGKTPLDNMRTMETWVYLYPYDEEFGSAVMPLLATGQFEWGLAFSGPGVFQQHVTFSELTSPVTFVNTVTGANLARGSFPSFVGEVNTWVHVAVVLAPDVATGLLTVSSYVNGELQFSSPSYSAGWLSNTDTLRIGGLLEEKFASKSEHRQWTKPFLDELRGWTRPLSSFEIRSRLHRGLTASELAWDGGNDFPDCFLYMPFANENFKTQVGTRGNVGAWYLRLASMDEASESLVYERSGHSTYSMASGPLSDQAYASMIVDMAATFPSSAPVSGDVQVIRAQADVPISFSFAATIATETAGDASQYQTLVPWRSAGVSGDDVTITITSIEWQDMLLISVGAVNVLGAYDGSLTLPDGSSLEVGSSLSVTTEVLLEMGAGQFSFERGLDLLTDGQKMRPVLVIQYTVTYLGLVSDAASVLVEVMPPIDPVVGPSGKALRCNGAGPLGSASSEYRTWRQWGASNVSLPRFNTTDYGEGGLHFEFWVLNDNLEGGEDPDRLQFSLPFSLGENLEEGFGIRIDGEMAFGLVLNSRRSIFGATRHVNPVRRWTHFALYTVGGDETTFSVWLDGVPFNSPYFVDVPEKVFEGLFLCGRPALPDDGVEDLASSSSRRGFEGAIDEVRVWRGMRTHEQLQQGMFKRLDPSTMSAEERASLLVYFDFEDDNEGVVDGVVKDRSGNGNDMVLGGCQVPTSDWPHGEPPLCAGGRSVAAPSHIPVTYHPMPESPVTNELSAQVTADMGSPVVVALEGYSPDIFRCPKVPMAECRSQSPDELPKFVLVDPPATDGAFGVTLSEFVLDTDTMVTSTVDLGDATAWASEGGHNPSIQITALNADAGGNPFTTLQYRLVHPTTGSESSVKRIDVNIRCAAGYRLNAVAGRCELCTTGFYRQEASFETTCCDMAAPGAGCFTCESGFIMFSSVSVPGTVYCDLPDCGEYETKVLLDEGGQKCVPSYDLPPGTRDALVALTTVVMCFVLAVLCVVVVYRRTRVMVNSSLPFLCLMLLGLVMMTASVFILLQPATESYCFLKTILFHVGFSLMFASATAKTWRLHKIFNNKNLSRVAVKNSELYRIVVAFVVMDLLLVGLWMTSAPFEVKDELQKECESDTTVVFFPLLLLEKTVLMGSGVYLAQKVKGVPSSFNESAGINLTLNNVTLMAVLMLGITNALGDQLKEGGITKLLEALGGLVGVIAPLTFIFVPKFKPAMSNKRQKTSSVANNNSSGGGTSTGGGGATVSGEGKKIGKLEAQTQKLTELQKRTLDERAKLTEIQNIVSKLEKEVMRAQDELDYMKSTGKGNKNVGGAKVIAVQSATD